MDDALRDQIRYLELRVRECSARPALHTRQIAAYRDQLALARASDCALAYLRRLADTGTTLAIVRAEWIDRYHNWGRMYAALGDEIRTETAAANRRAAEVVTDEAELMTALVASKVRHTPVEHAADENVGLLQSLVAALLEWRVAPGSPYRVQRERAVSALWHTLQNNDEQCTWQRICTYPPYRNRLPFSDRGLALLRDWLERVVGPRVDQPPGPDLEAKKPNDGSSPSPAPSAGPPAPAAGPVDLLVPDARQAAYAYHLTYDALDRADPDNRELCALYERVFALEDSAAHGPAFLRAMAEDDMYCQLARAPQLIAARRGLRRSVDRSQPHAEYHYRQLEQALLDCRSPTEIDYEVERASRIFAVEVAWNDSLLRVIGRVLVAVGSYVAEPDESHRRVVVASHRAACAMLDRTWTQIMAAPRVWDMFCRVWFAQGRILDVPASGAWGGDFGDIGAGALPGIREATVQRLLEQSAQVAAQDGGDDGTRASGMQPETLFATPEAMYDYLHAGLQRALADEPVTDEPGANPPGANPPGANSDNDSAPLVLWGQPVTLERLHEALSRPARPDINLDAAAYEL